VVFLRGDVSEVESNGGSGEGPACLCFRGGDCEAACERSGSGIFSPCVVLQRHFGDGSRMAVAFLVRCSLFFPRIPVGSTAGGFSGSFLRV
jgi:hypothetical protein